jgi:hypothetical protein
MAMAFDKSGQRNPTFQIDSFGSRAAIGPVTRLISNMHNSAIADGDSLGLWAPLIHSVNYSPRNDTIIISWVPIHIKFTHGRATQMIQNFPSLQVYRRK